jgi:hypothetical protein
MRRHLVRILVLLLCGVPAGAAEFLIAENGAARMTILTDASATAAERTAATELAEHLTKITGAAFAPDVITKAGVAPWIVVGPGALAARLCPDIAWDGLGAEEIVIRAAGPHLVLAGGRPRGTLYAVSRFLQDNCGVRWWAPWATSIPSQSVLRASVADRRERPAFEYREPFWHSAFDGRWAMRNACNGHAMRLTPEQGGRIEYRGFVHTFYPLVPPKKHFAAHPEWYSLLNGRRTVERGQLCLAHPGLRDFVAGAVDTQLAGMTEAAIASVSQNDWHGACRCDDCRALEAKYGGASGALLDFVNDIAGRLETKYPRAAIDTLAYQYTRAAPAHIAPRSNVIVRLCSIECDFRAPLDAPSNAAFARDLTGWSGLCRRLYVWDYTTDFAHYVQPHPNWFTLGPNVRFFRDHHVAGLFEQGAYQSGGAEMAELRAWVLAQLLWNPDRDDRALIDEFLAGYYGAAAPLIRRYLDLLYAASAGTDLGCYSPTDAPFLSFRLLAEAEFLWATAETAVEGDPELTRRVRVGRLPLWYVWLRRWDALRKERELAGARWPVPERAADLAREFLAVAKAPGPDGWTPITHLNESGLTPEKFVEPFLK